LTPPAKITDLTIENNYENDEENAILANFTTVGDDYHSGNMDSVRYFIINSEFINEGITFRFIYAPEIADFWSGNPSNVRFWDEVKLRDAKPGQVIQCKMC